MLLISESNGLFLSVVNACNWNIKGCGLTYPLTGMMHVKEILLLKFHNRIEMIIIIILYRCIFRAIVFKKDWVGIWLIDRMLVSGTQINISICFITIGLLFYSSLNLPHKWFD